MNAFHAASSLVVRSRGLRLKKNIAACPNRLYRHGNSESSFAFSTQVGTVAVLPPRRTFSSSSKLEQDDERKWKLLYHRNPSRTTSPRALLGVSSFNMCYWTWYVADFAPSVNASAHAKFDLGQIDAETLELLLIDPNMGYVGLGMSTLIWLGAFSYVRQLVSAIWAGGGKDSKALAISTLNLPFLTQPKILGRTVYDPESNEFDGVEDVEFAESELKAESVEMFAPGELTLSEDKAKHDVIVRFDGEFSKLRGHIALKKEDHGNEDTGVLTAVLKGKYLLDINSGDEVMPNASEALLHSLVIQDQHMPGSGEKGDRNGLRRVDKNDTRSGKGRRRSKPEETNRPVTQLEMTRRTLKESIRKKESNKR